MLQSITLSVCLSVCVCTDDLTCVFVMLPACVRVHLPVRIRVCCKCVCACWGGGVGQLKVRQGEA